MQALVKLENISKYFGSLIANENIDLEIFSGEALALLGENGAGKTTLSKMLFGMYKPSQGAIYINNQAVKLNSPKDAIDRGIGFVSQHFSLVPSLSVAENVVLAKEGGAILDLKKINEQVAATAKKYGLSLKPQAIVSELSVGEQQRVEILKALYRECKLLILDEPTAVLTPQDVQALFKTLKSLQEKGLAIIIITHKLDEVIEISDRVAILRHGKLVSTEITKETNARALANLMVGRDTIAVSRNTDHRVDDQILFAVKDLALKNKRGIKVLKDISFNIHASEILGIAGVAGNGQTELLSVLNGLQKPDRGEAILEKQKLSFNDSQHYNNLQIGRIPEDRHKATIADLSVAENLVLEHIEDFSKAGQLSKKAINQYANKLIKDFQIKAKANDKARTLSGGNLQKLILARTLAKEPKLLIVAQPTRGVDVGASEYVHQKLLEQKRNGAAILLISDDLDEVMRLSDRILVIYEGEIMAEFAAEDASREGLGLLMAGNRDAA